MSGHKADFAALDVQAPICGMKKHPDALMDKLACNTRLLSALDVQVAAPVV